MDLSVETELPPELEPNATALVELEFIISTREGSKQGEKFEEWLVR